jgi:two-component system cell cycle sensor histidine kinase/response regulator CckA
MNPNAAASPHDPQGLQMLGSLTARVAHELGNLLTPLVGFTELILRRIPPGDPLRDDLQDILRSGRRASVLVGQLLLFSNRRRTPATPIDLNTAVLDSLGMLRQLLPTTVRLATSLEPGLATVPIDALHVEQILLNLVSNARDAMPRGGALTLATESEERPVVNGHPGRPWVRLIVRDTGDGMDEATRARVFEPFFTTKKPGQGTGLGMTIVAEIVRHQGGDIEIESSPGRGTIVIVNLPCDARSDLNRDEEPTIEL